MRYSQTQSHNTLIDLVFNDKLAHTGRITSNYHPVFSQRVENAIPPYVLPSQSNPPPQYCMAYMLRETNLTRMKLRWILVVWNLKCKINSISIFYHNHTWGQTCIFDAYPSIQVSSFQHSTNYLNYMERIISSTRLNKCKTWA